MCFRNSLLISSRLNFSRRDSSFRSSSSEAWLSFCSFVVPLRSVPSPSRLSYLLFLLLNWLSLRFLGSELKRLRPEEATTGMLSRSFEFVAAAVRLLPPAGVFLGWGERALVSSFLLLFMAAVESSTSRLLRYEPELPPRLCSLSNAGLTAAPCELLSWCEAVGKQADYNN